MLRSIIGKDGNVHVESENGSLRQDLTTGETSFLGPETGGVRMVTQGCRSHLETRLGNMRQELGGSESGASWVLSER